MATADQRYDEAIDLQQAGKLEEAIGKLEQLAAEAPQLADFFLLADDAYEFDPKAVQKWFTVEGAADRGRYGDRRGWVRGPRCERGRFGA